MLPLLAVLVLSADPAPDWAKPEARHLTNIRQVTRDFVRAGEGYFSPDGKTIIFQAEEKDTGNPFYQIFTQNLATGKVTRVSPGVGKTTCSFFRPDDKKIIFASSHLDPDAKKKYAEEYAQRDEDKKAGRHRRYKWDFDPHMTIFEADPDGGHLKRLTQGKGYHAEGSYSPDGKHIVFCSNSSNEADLELYIMDADGKNVRQLTHTPGCYNGGPFFSPDGKKVIFRSDRKKKDHLQLYVIDADGKHEKELTSDLNWVNWGPYWYKDGRHIIYAGADHSDPTARPNYDLYWMRIDGDPKSVKQGRARELWRDGFLAEGLFSPFSGLSASIPYQFCTVPVSEKEKTPASPKKVRITYAPGADILPVFSPDYKKLMWTSTRDGRQPAQLYIADFTPPKDDE